MTTQTKTNWRMVKLGDIADVQWGDTNTTKAAYKPAGFIAFSATGADGFMDHYDFDRDGVVLSAIGANCGETWFAHGKWSAIKNTIVFWGKSSKSDTKFLFYKTHNKKLWPVRGSAQPFISQGDAREMELLIPENPDDQKRIADIISAFDDKIELNNKISAALEQMAQAIFKEWFVNFRFPGHEKVKMVDSELGKTPEGWEIKKFGTLLKLKHGRGFRSEEFGDEKTDRVLVRMGNFRETGGLQFDDNTKYLKSESYHNKDRLQPDDLVMVLSDVTRDGRIIGRVGLVPEDEKVYLLNQRVAKIETQDMYKLFLLYFFNSETFRQHCLMRADSATVLNLKNDHIYEIKMVIPDRGTLKEFNDNVSVIYKRKREIEKENQKLAALRDLLLPKLMSGEIRV